MAGGRTGGEYYRCLLVFGMEEITKNRTLLLQMLLLNFSDGVGGVGGKWTTTTTTCYLCSYYCKSIRLDLRRMGSLGFCYRR
jgi:hypothetical protein